MPARESPQSRSCHKVAAPCARTHRQQRAALRPAAQRGVQQPEHRVQQLLGHRCARARRVSLGKQELPVPFRRQRRAPCHSLYAASSSPSLSSRAASTGAGAADGGGPERAGDSARGGSDSEGSTAGCDHAHRAPRGFTSASALSPSPSALKTRSGASIAKESARVLVQARRSAQRLS
jgi:hypothetical protein